MIEFKSIEGVSKKTGKPFTGYCFVVGEFQSPLFFPSNIELKYIQEHLDD